MADLWLICVYEEMVVTYDVHDLIFCSQVHLGPSINTMTLRTHGPEVFTRSVARPSRIATCAVLAVLLLSAKTASVDGAVQHGAKHPESYIGETYSGFIKRFGDKLVDQNCREYFANGWNS